MARLIFILVLGFVWFSLTIQGTNKYLSISVGVWKVVSVFVLGFLYMAYKRYCALWRRVSTRKSVIDLYEWIYVPATCLSLPLTLPWYKEGAGVLNEIFSNPFSCGIIFSALIVLMSDRQGKLRKLVEENYTLGRDMDHALMYQDGESSRADMILSHVGYNSIPIIVLCFSNPMFSLRRLRLDTVHNMEICL